MRRFNVLQPQRGSFKGASLTWLRIRLAMYLQLLIATGCVISFERYIQTGRHPLGWEEKAVMLAFSSRWILFFWVAIEVTVPGFQLWRRITCLIASLLLTEIIDTVFWVAMVRY